MAGRRPSLAAASTCVCGVIVAAIALAVVLSFALNAAADDLHAQASLARGVAPDVPRTVIGSWLASRIAPDVLASNPIALDQRSQEVDHRADRIRELAGDRKSVV